MWAGHTTEYEAWARDSFAEYHLLCIPFEGSLPFLTFFTMIQASAMYYTAVFTHFKQMAQGILLQELVLVNFKFNIKKFSHWLHLDLGQD